MDKSARFGVSQHWRKPLVALSAIALMAGSLVVPMTAANASVVSASLTVKKSIGTDSCDGVGAVLKLTGLGQQEDWMLSGIDPVAFDYGSGSGTFSVDLFFCESYSPGVHKFSLDLETSSGNRTVSGSVVVIGKPSASFTSLKVGAKSLSGKVGYKKFLSGKKVSIFFKHSGSSKYKKLGSAKISHSGTWKLKKAVKPGKYYVLVPKSKYTAKTKSSVKTVKAAKTVKVAKKKATKKKTTKKSSSGTSSSFYANCTAARAAGVTPIFAGEPGYSSKLDRDGDGIACE